MSTILLVALTVGLTGAAATVVLLQEPSEQPVAAGFVVQDGDRLELLKTSGEALDAEPTRLYVGTPEGSASLPLGEVPGIGQAWNNGQAVCLAGEGSRCLAIEGADEIADVRVVHDDQALFAWQGDPAVDDLGAGSGPRLSVADDTGDEGDGEDDGEPDLRLVSLEPSEDAPVEGEAVAFEATVANVGDAPTETSTSLEVELDGSLHDTVTVPELADGASTTLTTDAWTARTGNHTASAHADPDDRTADTDPSNDDAHTEVAVAGEDPGHAYEDVDNDALFTPGTDRKIPDSDIHDGVYHVQDPWSLVVPASVGAISAERVNFTAGSEGHVIVDVDLATTDERVNIHAGSYVQAANVTLSSPDERIRLASASADVRANASTFDSDAERIVLDAGGDVHARGAHLASADERTIVRAGGSVDLADATLDANEKVPITAGDDLDLTEASLAADEEITIDAVADAEVTVTDATISDEDDQAIVSPDDAAIVGTTAEGDVAHEDGGGGGGQGGPP